MEHYLITPNNAHNLSTSPADLKTAIVVIERYFPAVPRNVTFLFKTMESLIPNDMDAGAVQIAVVGLHKFSSGAWGIVKHYGLASRSPMLRSIRPSLTDIELWLQHTHKFIPENLAMIKRLDDAKDEPRILGFCKNESSDPELILECNTMPDEPLCPNFYLSTIVHRQGTTSYGDMGLSNGLLHALKEKYFQKPCTTK